MTGPVTRAVGTARSGDHFCHPFDGELERDELAARFLAAGLDRREKLLYLYSDDSAGRGLIDALQGLQAQPESLLQHGVLDLVDAREVYQPAQFEPEAVYRRLDRMIDAVTQQGWSGLRVAADLAWMAGADAPDQDRLVDYELRLADCYGRRPLTGMCQYERQAFPPDRLARLVDVHPMTAEADALYADGLLHLLPTWSPTGVRVRGDVDLSNAHALAAVLRRLIDGVGELHLDLAALRFMDLGGVRALIEVARQFSPGACLVLHRAPAFLQRVLDLGWGPVPGLVVTA